MGELLIFIIVLAFATGVGVGHILTKKEWKDKV